MLRTYDDWKSDEPEGKPFMCECCGRLMHRPGPCSRSCEAQLIEEMRAEERETQRMLSEAS